MGIGNLHTQSRLHFLNRGHVAIERLLQDIPLSAEIKNNDQQRETEGNRQSQAEVTGVTEEQAETAGQQSKELRDTTGDCGFGQAVHRSNLTGHRGRRGVKFARVLGLMNRPAVPPVGQILGIQHLIET